MGDDGAAAVAASPGVVTNRVLAQSRQPKDTPGVASRGSRTCVADIIVISFG